MDQRLSVDAQKAVCAVFAVEKRDTRCLGDHLARPFVVDPVARLYFKWTESDYKGVFFSRVVDVLAGTCSACNRPRTDLCHREHIDSIYADVAVEDSLGLSHRAFSINLHL